MAVRVYRVDSKPKKRFSTGLSMNTNIILINVFLFFILKLIFPDQIVNVGGKVVKAFHPFLLNNIAISLDNVLSLRIWTFLTSMFMHGGFAHLFVNMFSLFFVGGLIQKILGAKRYLYFYLGAGLFAGVFFILAELFSTSHLPAVGASGALFGLIGLLVLLTPNVRVYLMFIPIPIKMKYAGPGMLVVLWIISATANIPLGNMAHLGGLVAGLVYGIYLKSKFPNKTKMISKSFG